MNSEDLFLCPANSTHRQYEALRAVFVDGLSPKDAAEKFGYEPGGFRVLLCKFRKNPHQNFFRHPEKGPRAAPKRDRHREKAVALRKQNLSIYDIAETLNREGYRISAVSVSKILKQEGFSPLPKRSLEERSAKLRPEAAKPADVRELNLEPRRFTTRFGGLFLFVPYLVDIPLQKILAYSHFPGTQKIPARNAVLALLGLKLFGTSRHSHVMASVHDDGLALFAGLNTPPKRSFLTQYSCRVDPSSYPILMRHWFDAIGGIGLDRGESLDLDFHTIPFHGEDALVEKHYVSKRSRRQKGILAFLAQDAERRMFCYGNVQIRKQEQNDEILRFVAFWKKRTGRLPQELVFDSKLTTYKTLNKLNRKDIPFITLRRRSSKNLQKIHSLPSTAWRQIQLSGVSRAFKNPKILDRRITLKDYEGDIRELVAKDLGHEEPTLFLTNQLKRCASEVIQRYAERMIIENTIEEGIDFFHMDALSSAVPMKVNLDLQLTLMGSSLYRLLARQIGNGYENAKARTVFRNFIEAAAHVMITEREIVVSFQKRANNPLLQAAGFGKTDKPVPWLRGRRLQFQLG
jgi:transposase